MEYALALLFQIGDLFFIWRNVLEICQEIYL